MAPKKKQLKKRLDEWLVARGLASDVDEAQRFIMAGEVWRGTERLTKPGVRYAEDVEFRFEPLNSDVGRGAQKLRAALEAFPMQVEGRVALDLGASTGGFTQVLLEQGAQKVFALDVGKGLLADSLRRDERVVPLEEKNARHFDPAWLGGESFDLVVSDVSFISLKKVLLPVLKWCGARGESASGEVNSEVGTTKPLGESVVLVKPQFEAEKHEVGRGGIVRDDKVIERILDDFRAWSPSPDWSHVADLPSPIKGTKGNQEFLFYYQLDDM
jgi:23S rRNA (cytidine1920-2'-O)/16S rRNA (cytidine1409-2'-O)-methyltransferase